uniref:Uncharacterized protein n=1 Tax=Opuntia streptacantha TaxID=393608 RepID=A0A7C8ZHA4_OPUST
MNICSGSTSFLRRLLSHGLGMHQGSLCLLTRCMNQFLQETSSSSPYFLLHLTLPLFFLMISFFILIITSILHNTILVINNTLGIRAFLSNTFTRQRSTTNRPTLLEASVQRHPHRHVRRHLGPIPPVAAHGGGGGGGGERGGVGQG